MNKSLILLALGSMLAAIISFVRLTQQRKKQKRKREKQKQKQQKKEQQLASTSTTLLQKGGSLERQNDERIRQLYEEEVMGKNPEELFARKPIYREEIQGLSYWILLNLNKSRIYEGVVRIRTTSRKSTLNQRDLYIDYRGSNILYFSINHNKVEEAKIQLNNHQICISKQLLLPHQNNIQIIFTNNYSFLGDGLNCYFPLQQSNKYSLKGQVIYTTNGSQKVTKIIPCLNILNPCEIKLQILHPNGFHTESNTYKLLTKMVTKKDYPLYPFLFQIGLNSSLNSSRRLNNSFNNSGTSETTIKSSDQIIKVKAEFSIVTLGSIHDFFVFCSACVEVKPLRNLSASQINLHKSKCWPRKQVLIRYFCKDQIAKKASYFLNILQSQISEMLERIQQFRTENKSMGKIHGKIDIFFINDIDSQGSFNSGAILLSQSSVSRGIIDRRLSYLISRAFVGIALLSKKNHFVTIQDNFKLNQLTLQIFSECCDYIYVKNIQYAQVKDQYDKIAGHHSKNDEYWQREKIEELQSKEEQTRLLLLSQYFQKQCRYLVNDLHELGPKVSKNVQNIIQNLQIMSSQQYWIYFVGKYPFLEFNVSEILISLSLSIKGVPRSQSQLNFAKDNFIKSKHYLKFFVFRQVQNNLKIFIQLKSYGLEEVLPFIKIKQSCLSLIPPQIQSYLPARENRFDCEKLYQQFKRFNQEKNFHHKTALSRQINRICLFLRGNLKLQRIDICCSLYGWKILTKLQLFPLNEKIFKVVSWLAKITKMKEREGLHLQKLQIVKINQKQSGNYKISIQQRLLTLKIESEQKIQFARERKDSESRLLQEISQMERLLEG